MNMEPLHKEKEKTGYILTLKCEFRAHKFRKDITPQCFHKDNPEALCNEITCPLHLKIVLIRCANCNQIKSDLVEIPDQKKKICSTCYKLEFH